MTWGWIILGILWIAGLLFFAAMVYNASKQHKRNQDHMSEEWLLRNRRDGHKA